MFELASVDFDILTHDCTAPPQSGKWENKISLKSSKKGKGPVLPMLMSIAGLQHAALFSHATFGVYENYFHKSLKLIVIISCFVSRSGIRGADAAAE